MGKINILEKEITSKIAAGEVVEGPFSVAKELIENSIDAGSKNIVIEIKKGGKDTIKVIDDGEGMSREDVRLAFQRYATSKIRKIDDIFNIKTMGFRGEALASIAAVSNLSIITKTRDESIGTLCKLKGGVIENIEECTARDGCLIEVTNLFYNTPARLKFLRNDTAETSRILDLITRFAIGNVNISFKMISDGKQIFYTSGNGDFTEVIAKVYGINCAKQAIYLENNFEYGRVWGFISPPSFNKGNRSGQTFFVNRRFVKDKGLAFCIDRAYKTLIPVKRFPIAIIFIDIDASQIDVNVHPSKMQIKFRNENQVHQALFKAIKDSLSRSVLIPKETLSTQNKQSNQNLKDINEQIEFKEEILPKNEYYNINYNKINSERKIFVETVKESSDLDERKKDHDKISIGEKSSKFNLYYSDCPNLQKDTLQKFSYKRVLGQLFNTYIVVEGWHEFFLIDQHAAHERILYEYYSNKFNKPLDLQTLAVPYVLNLSAQEMMLAKYFKTSILKLGFDFSSFGSDSIIIRSVPYILNRPVDPIALRDVLDEVSSKQYADYPESERLIISLSCHTAIKAGESLSEAEIQKLLEQLKQVKVPYTCPHGRPTIISITLKELEKKFKRT